MNTDQLTFTRFIAAMSIVVYHFGDIFYPFNLPDISTLIHQANLGVSYFFVLSGFVMVLAYGNKKEKIGFTGYMKNRIARIVPLYYLAMLLMLLYLGIRLVIIKLPFHYTPSFTDTALHISFLQAWIPGKATTLNTAAWSLSVEALFYLSFPLLMNRLRHWQTKNVVILAILFFVASQLVFHQTTASTYFATALYHPILHFNSFLLGVATGLILIRHIRHALNSQIVLITLLSTVILVVLYFPIKGLSYHNGMLSLLFAPLILALAIDNSFISKTFSKGIFIHLGEISYGIYILQFPVFFFYTATLTYFGLKINHLLFYLYLLILIAASDLSYRFVEKPLRAKIRAIGN